MMWKRVKLILIHFDNFQKNLEPRFGGLYKQPRRMVPWLHEISTQISSISGWSNLWICAGFKWLYTCNEHSTTMAVPIFSKNTIIWTCVLKQTKELSPTLGMMDVCCYVVHPNAISRHIKLPAICLRSNDVISKLASLDIYVISVIFAYWWLRNYRRPSVKLNYTTPKKLKEHFDTLDLYWTLSLKEVPGLCQTHCK